MSIRSLANGDLILRNLTITGTLTTNEATIPSDLSIENLDVSNATNLNILTATGATNLNSLTATGATNLINLTATGSTSLNTLSTSGSASVNSLNVVGTSTLTNTNITGSTSLTDNVAEITTYDNIVVGQDLSPSVLKLNDTNTTYSGGSRSLMIELERAGVNSQNWTSQAGIAMGNYTTTDDGTALDFDLSYLASSGSGGNFWDFVKVLSLWSISTTEGRVGVNNPSPQYNLDVIGTANASGNLTIGADITASGNVSCNDINCGDITCNSINGVVPQNNMTISEVVFASITGNASSYSGTIGITNPTGANNYSVYPSVYYGSTGSSGTYDASGTAEAIQYIITANRQINNFDFYGYKTDGNNVAIYVQFLVIYKPSSSPPSSY